MGVPERGAITSSLLTAYEYDAIVGPTVEHVLHFQTHGFKTRQNYSSLQLDGLGDTWGDLAVPYLLAKFVFTELKYTRDGLG